MRDDARRREKCEKMREGLREMLEKNRANLCDDARNARNVRAGMREVARRCENVRGIQLKIPGKSTSRGSSC